MENINSSIGVELECVVGIQVGQNPRTKPRMFQTAKGNPIRFDDENYEWHLGTPPQVIDAIKQRIKEAVAGHEGDRIVNSEAELLGDQNSWHLKNFAVNWDVKRDASVYLNEEYAIRDSGFNNYHFVDIEITSPALRATENSYAEIHHVITTLRDTFWLVTPRSAGLHVHYGRCKDWIPLDHLRRIAALLYAADPILIQIQPAVRRLEGQRWCRSNRLYCNLAHGWRAQDAQESITRISRRPIEVELQPETVPESKVPEVEKTPRPSVKRSRNFTSIFPRGSLEGYAFSRRDFDASYQDYVVNRHSESHEGTPLGIIPAARELLSCVSAPIVSDLMGYKWVNRLAYNFNAYNHEHYRRFRMNRDQTINIDNQPKRTIEFRQPAGTLNVDLIIATAKIVVRICEFASTATAEELWKLICDLDMAEKHREWYDVFDFLVDLDLDNEAKVIQRHMAEQRGLEIIDEENGVVRIATSNSAQPQQPVPSSYLGRFFSKLVLKPDQQTPPNQSETGVTQGAPGGSQSPEISGSTDGDDLLWLELGTGPILPN
ncbi:uncharacterized protein GGS22DRAFT_199191 [Annulohypoxylon maeteangense]|uniref:uncharacterized protein n=1 Tax=Annulohypoxylon maeteangense TaxID=1927788 RepID=UPI0020077D39|nr:uncharacterized protein GGS22DRAFT_199191 [Annulohypoxylon maeteangense]KAI0886887.1 hypothetical protein GGS22DRAFT_199191 [Annulohypoxylon maeteangense]